MGKLITLAGGDGPVNEGERRVIAILLEQLPNDYWVIPNVEILDRDGQTFEYDVIVIAPHAVYVLETKDWYGEIRIDDREWLVNGKTRKSPLSTTERKAKILKSKLVAKAPVLARVWVEAAVVLASQPSIHSSSAEETHRVFQLDSLIRFLTDPTQVKQLPRAIADLDDAIRRALGTQLQARSGPLVFGPYEVIEVLEQNGEALYRARHRDMPGAPAVRLRVVYLSPYILTPQQRKARRSALYREMEAILRMGSHPNIITAREVFEDDANRIVLVMDNVEGRSLRQRLLDGTPMTVEERLDVLIGICRALVHAHSPAHQVIHRRIEPQTILLGDDGIPRLSHFDLAKLISPDATTVWHDDTPDEIDRRYLAPELANPAYGDPSPATDLYELGCVAYELFAGKPPFVDPAQAFGGMPALPGNVPERLPELLKNLLQGDPALRSVDTKGVLAALEKMRGTDSSQRVSGPKEYYVAGDVIDGKFEVREVLGKGGMARVYRVYWALDDTEYALKVFNEQVPYEKVQQEITLLQSISHPHIVRSVWADQTRTGQWYIVTELIRGETLEAYATGKKRLAPAEAIALIVQLLSALEVIHPNDTRIAELKQKTDDFTEEEYEELRRLQSRGMVHRDIKPQNLMLCERGMVLIDFNISSRVGQPVLTQSGTPPYQSPDLWAGVDNWDPSPDLFAVGVVLYELLCYEHPYDHAQPRVDRLPHDPREFRPEISAPLAEFLLKACAPHRADRFSNAKAMREALMSISPLVEHTALADSKGISARLRDLLAKAPPNINPMVHEFLTLSSQARHSNRGTRGMDDLAEATYVETRLDKTLTDSVLAGQYQLIIVTGNAGDGKTAFIQKLEAAARHAGAFELNKDSNGSHLNYSGRIIFTLYDGSQDEAGQTSDEVLRQFLAPFAHGGKEQPNAVRLAAINEGRLRDFLMTYRSDFPGFAENVIASLDEPVHTVLSGAIIIVNLNLRSVTADGADSIFSQQLRSIVSGPFWKPCEKCAYQTRCPIKFNVDTFRDSISGPAVTERLRTMVDIVRLRRRRHITMRDVRSLISHLLFRDRNCEEIPELLASNDPFSILDIAYFQGPGGTGTPPNTELERGAKLLKEIDVALTVHPEDDRSLAHGQGQRRMAFPDRLSDYPAELLRVLRERARTGYDADVALARRVHEAARRRSYFERADDGWWSMLPYQRLKVFNEALTVQDNKLRSDLLNEIIRAISRLEGIDDIGRSSTALWLATTESKVSDFTCYRRYPLEDFILDIAEITAPFVEVEPDHLQLVHTPSHASLDIDIDLLEVLERLGEGYVPSMDEGRGFLVNLVLFKRQLLAQPTKELFVGTDKGMVQIALDRRPGGIALKEEVL